MKDWVTYSKTKANDSVISNGDKPSIFEYFCIKMVDNGLLVTVFAVTIIFSAIGAVLFVKNIAINSWFLDAAKLSFGVVLGMLAERKK